MRDAHAGVARYLVGVDDEELGLLRDQLFLHFAGQVLPDLLRPERAVEQEHVPPAPGR